MGRYLDPPKAPHAGLVHTVHGATFGRFAGWLERAASRRRTRLELGRLGDDGLKDLGLTRDHVEADLGNYF
ncbi:DUF1127 domain-containing protein [Phyllobacterium lublinensis]|uniref:DUF1127 domain-containing protein n=1 Tax=Phyllobacterium lublinensis TaxID=2875708 RepID=UPI001CCFD084|nr:DUF1127 domain-containing protein [Phyllobacterium sp. 2063]MBZ9653400.1 DUF1127 domain-containing protein [Phyllobacterium sp. 2063]